MSLQEAITDVHVDLVSCGGVEWAYSLPREHFGKNKEDVSLVVMSCASINRELKTGMNIWKRNLEKNVEF